MFQLKLASLLQGFLVNVLSPVAWVEVCTKTLQVFGSGS